MLEKTVRPAGFFAVVSMVLFFSQAALALENSFFVGISVGESKFDISRAELTAALDDGSLTSSRLDNEDSSVKLSFGYWLSNYIGIELSYVDLGELSFRAVSDGSGSRYNAGSVTADAEVDAITFGLVGRLPVNNWFELTGRLGVFSWEMDITVTNAGAFGRGDEDGNDIYFGIGAAFRMTPQFSVGLEFDRYDLDGDDIDAVSIGLIYSFK